MPWWHASRHTLGRTAVTTDSRGTCCVFDAAYPIAHLNPAPYNPRRIDDARIARLRLSVRTLGLIKPVIATREGGILLAGHQRTQAMLAEGLAECPAYVLDGVTTTDEIRFNQIHNASDIDTMEAPLYVPAQPVANTWAHVAPEDLRGNLRTKNAARKSEILRLLAKHGEWGSAVVTQSGEVLASGLYAVCCTILHLPIRVYVVRDDQREDVLRYFGQSYGQFSFDHLPQTTWG